jgi:hypothetical protein
MGRSNSGQSAGNYNKTVRESRQLMPYTPEVGKEFEAALNKDGKVIYRVGRADAERTCIQRGADRTIGGHFVRMEPRRSVSETSVPGWWHGGNRPESLGERVYLSVGRLKNLPQRCFSLNSGIKHGRPKMDRHQAIADGRLPNWAQPEMRI